MMGMFSIKKSEHLGTVSKLCQTKQGFVNNNNDELIHWQKIK